MNLASLPSVVSQPNGDLWVPCLLGERSETASMFAAKVMPTASVGMAPILPELRKIHTVISATLH